MIAFLRPKFYGEGEEQPTKLPLTQELDSGLSKCGMGASLTLRPNKTPGGDLPGV